jgi:S-adenosylmethionine:tRNA ribosyltransferase-isomerase
VSKELYNLRSYQFDLPDELIAQKPALPRDSSRLLVVSKATGTITECRFSEIVDLVEPGDTFIANESRVVPARLVGQKSTGARIEALLLERKGEGRWLALVKPASKLRVGNEIIFEGNLEARVEEDLPDGRKILAFTSPASDAKIEQFGHIPLPPYIQRADMPEDRTWYQTVFAKTRGSIAAPTAGLHFTNELLTRLRGKGVGFLTTSLHVGLGTFLPIRTEDIRDHKMHEEHYYIDPMVAEALNLRDMTKRHICVGTTSLRTLEAASDEAGHIHAGSGVTSLYIYPGYRFRFAKSLLTNFHLPGSTLFILVCAFLGPDLAQEVYRKAIERRFRFFSYGDAMLAI